MGATEIITLDRSALREIPGYEGFYAASADGRIYSLRRAKWLAPALNRGYLVVSISVGGRTKVCKIHRLVALAWIPNPLALPQVNHLNGIKSDNRVKNLEWADASTNQIHARLMGLSKTTDAMRAASSRNICRVGETLRKLSLKDAVEIRNSNLSCADEAIARNVSTSAIHAIRKGKTYRAQESAHELT